MKIFSTLLLGCMLLAAPALAVVPVAIEADEVIVRVPMPGRTVTAGYMTLRNLGAESRQLTAVHSEAFERIELHTHTHVDGMMRMIEVDSIEVPAGGEAVLRPGGLHLMLFEPALVLEEDGSIVLQLQFDDGTELAVTARLVMPPRR